MAAQGPQNTLRNKQIGNKSGELIKVFNVPSFSRSEAHAQFQRAVVENGVSEGADMEGQYKSLKGQLYSDTCTKVLIYDKQGSDIISPLLTVKDLRNLGVTLHL